MNPTCGRTRFPDFGQASTVPAYVVASYSNTLHTAGTFRAWRRIASEHKWLRIHNSQEWPDYYDEANVEDLRRNSSTITSRMRTAGGNRQPRSSATRFSIFEGGDQINLGADAVPPNRASPRRSTTSTVALETLTTEAPTDGGSSRPMTSTATPNAVSFIVIRFDQRDGAWSAIRKLTSSWKHSGADDMDLFVLVQKLDCAWHAPSGSSPCPIAWRDEFTTSPITERASCVTRDPTAGCASPLRRLDEDAVDRRRPRALLRQGR